MHNKNNKQLKTLNNKTTKQKHKNKHIKQNTQKIKNKPKNNIKKTKALAKTKN